MFIPSWYNIMYKVFKWLLILLHFSSFTAWFICHLVCKSASFGRDVLMFNTFAEESLFFGGILFSTFCQLII